MRCRVLRPVCRTACLSTGHSAGALGLFGQDADNAPCRSEEATPGSCSCVCVLAPLDRVGRAGLLGAFWCASPYHVAGLGALFVCSAPSGLQLPCLWLLLCFFFLFFSPFLFVGPFVSGVPCFPAQGALGRGSPRPAAPSPRPVCLFFYLLPAFPLFFVFLRFFRLLFFFLFFFTSCRGSCAVRGWFVCPGLWGVLVCVAVRVVPRRGPVCACSVSFGAPYLSLFSVCCCLSRCTCPVAPCWRRFSSPCCLWCPVWVHCPLVLFCDACGLSLPLGAVLWGCAVAPGLVVLFRLALMCRVGLFGLLFCSVVGCCSVLSAPPRVLSAYFFWCVLVVLPPPPPPPPPPAGCDALCCALSCVVPCGAAVCGVLCVLPGAVWRACGGLGSCALPSGAVLCWVLLCCSYGVRVSRAAVFSVGFFLALFLVLPCCSGLFLSVWCSAVVRPAVRRGPLALLFCAGFCCAVPFGALLCCAASPGSVLCYVFRCGAWVASCHVRCCRGLLCSVCPCARCCVVLLCFLWSACCRSLCRVSGLLPFPGASCVMLCWCACVVALCAVLSRASGTGWCCVLLHVMFGCLLNVLAVLRCLLVAPGIVFGWCCPCLALWPAALWFGVVCLSALLPCVVFCGAVLSCGGMLSGSAVCLRRCLRMFFSLPLPFLLCVSWGVVLCGPCPLRSMGCSAALCWCPCVLLFAWSAPSLAPGAVVRCCVLCCCLWCSHERCWVSLSPGVFWLRVSVSVCLSGRVAYFPVVGGLAAVPCSPVLCPVVLCCRVVMCCGVQVSF